MTVFELIKQCLQREAFRTEPDKHHAIRKVMKGLNKEQKEKSIEEANNTDICIKNSKEG